MRTIHHKWFAATTAVVALFGLGLLAATDVKAQENAENPLVKKTVPLDVYCGETEKVHMILDRVYNETPVAMSWNLENEKGLGPEGAYTVWFTNPERSTFSIVSDGGMGVSCILITGNCEEGNCFIPNASLWK